MSGSDSGSLRNLLQPTVRTPLAGFALQNATPTIATWIAPNDGQLHQAFVAAVLVVTVNEVGGQVFARWTGGGAAQVQTAFNGGVAIGGAIYNLVAVVDPGATIHLDQNTALTGGAASVFAVINGT